MEHKTRVVKTRIASQEFVENQTLQMIAKTFQYKAEKGLVDERHINRYNNKLNEERASGAVSEVEFQQHLAVILDKESSRNLSPQKRANSYEQRLNITDPQPQKTEAVKQIMVGNQPTICNSTAGWIFPEYKYVSHRIDQAKPVRLDHIGSALTTLMEDVKGNKIGAKEAQPYIDKLHGLNFEPGTPEHNVLTTVSRSYQQVFEKKGVLMSFDKLGVQ